MSDKKCKKLGNRATKAEREEARHIKLMMKEARNEQNHKDLSNRRDHVFANLSVHHPDYGETPSEQTRRMSEKSS